MNIQLALVLVAVCVSVGSGASLGPDNQSQELFVYQQNIYASESVRLRREVYDDSTMPFHLEVAKIMYVKLMECRANNSATTTPKPPSKAHTFIRSVISATTTPKPPSKDCQEYYEQGKRTDGVYEIEIPNSQLEPFNVWCDFFDGHGWTVIQKRLDGSVDFYLNWVDYKNGFGNVSGEYWLGNDRIHALTQTNQRLNIYLKAADGTIGNGTWSQFHIGDESDKYRLSVSSDAYTGNLDSSRLQYHDTMQFSTKDQDNDGNSGICATSYTGAWWYNSCSYVNINGVYNSNNHRGVYWHGFSSSLVATTMRVSRD